MSDISPITGNSYNQPLPSTHRTAPGTEHPHRGPDEVQLSDRARYLARVQREPGVRHELVERVRTEIDAGRYETDERIDIAVKRLGLDILA